MPSPILTVDILIQYDNGEMVFIKRGKEPCLGQWAIPGGRVEIGETVEQAATREAREETGLDVRVDRMIGVYSDPQRDPRRHTVSVAFLAHPMSGELRASSDAADYIRTADFQSLQLAFDHASILADALDGKAGQIR